ncbi:PBECR4 domain-containing protein [Limosilactobacillus caecicola]|uniref:PBECR4 domain-containing protein n=1 Tax=Limosilactobacillus caecicola TaxID=2941332 RepID=UPI00203A7324|nr:PBECR4 domain-containing protein [Limosilactobacillus caecicola]
MEYYQVKSSLDINYQKILNDYRRWFATRQIVLTTNYKLLDKFTVVFSESDLPHLMGWEKVVSKKAYARNILHLVDNKMLTYTNSRHHHRFKDIKNRLLNYNFLHEIFWKHDPDICVMTSNMKPNPLRLDIVFTKNTSPREIVVLGLRRKKHMESFVPTTLHTESAKNNRYLLRRKTHITSFRWQ